MVTLKTEDGVSIVGDYYAAEGARGVVLLHMMPATRKSFSPFAEKLQQAGFHVLNIDLRGHGESEGGPEGYKKFLDAAHQGSRFDVASAVEFLERKGVMRMYFAGASIGANLALEYISEHPTARGAILLSPGLNYRGIRTENAMRRLRPQQGVFLVASSDDSYSFTSTEKLAALSPADENRRVKFFRDAGHGTSILEKNPEFMDELIRWLRQEDKQSFV